MTLLALCGLRYVGYNAGLNSYALPCFSRFNTGDYTETVSGYIDQETQEPNDGGRVGAEPGYRGEIAVDSAVCGLCFQLLETRLSSS
jgi:hypothetical protein